MNDIKIYYDSEETKEAEDTIEFEPVEAGKKDTRNLYVRNKIDSELEFNIKIKGDIIKEINGKIEPLGLFIIKLDIEAGKNAIKPIKAVMNIRTRYLIR